MKRLLLECMISLCVFRINCYGLENHLERDNSQFNVDCDSTSANMCPKGKKHMEEGWVVVHDSGCQ